MSKKSKQTGAETGDDVSSLFAKLGSSGATAYQDFSADRLSAAEPAAAAPPPAAPAPAPVLSVVRAAVEPRPAAPLPVAPAAPAAPVSAAVIGTATGTPLQQLFQRLLEVGREAAVPAPGGPLKRFLNR
ncbi:MULTISPECIES: hypothetical protein [Xanthomonas]|uniref:hypothetical protein n=1 Tax=Xanthomonas TaxID=338 RepID=UPI001263A694|nr:MULTISPECIES: hypothetical protein [Xanthomonas]KAB7765984.1 hypothetical protein CEK69_16230 [Xanthomonas sp. LMG 12462]KAB7776948.1 hypothetical protein CEK65_12425 [Xanthomonas sp. LMG 12459]KAB7777196.1 hypothetical protein CEK66_12060 [Xanthomonas sp. LMG 12460]MCW0392599.1 hypothetical protein [Xanthomonas sacchari]MCW0404717.1 hypothetical protein [Xanthomonas sacchari]